MSGVLPNVDDHPVMCGVCGRVGAFKVDHGWRHDSQDEPADHPFVATEIAVAPAQLQARCDFCNITGSIPWLLPCDDFELPFSELGPEPRFSCGAWAACDVCADLIRRNRWRKLVDRAVQVRSGGVSARELTFYRAGFTHLYSKVRRHATGPIHRDPTYTGGTQ